MIELFSIWLVFYMNFFRAFSLWTCICMDISPYRQFEDLYLTHLPRQFISQYSQYPWTCFPANTKVEHQYFSSVGSHAQLLWTFPWNSNGKMQLGVGALTVVQFKSEKKIAQKVHNNSCWYCCRNCLCSRGCSFGCYWVTIFCNTCWLGSSCCHSGMSGCCDCSK